MSYSFNVRAATKALAKQAVTKELVKVVAAQPAHSVDALQAAAAAHAYIDLLDDSDTRHIVVTVAGSLSGNWVGNDIAQVHNVKLSIQTARG